MALVPTALSRAEGLQATVMVNLLSCRYGPGPAYLFLYALREGAGIWLIGRTDGENWDWVYVEGLKKCWVNANYLRVSGDPKGLPVVYPDHAKLPASPYYPPVTIRKVSRDGAEVTVEWVDTPLRAGDEEDAFMQHYIAEIWRCQNGRMLFEPVATNLSSITIVDEAGCSQPSHGRLFLQEKHGFAGPTDIPWPASE